MGALTITNYGIYELDMCAFPWPVESTGPQITSDIECRPGTSALVGVESFTGPQSLENLTQIEKADTTVMDPLSTYDAFKESRDLTGTRARSDLVLFLEELILTGSLSQFVSLVEALDWSTHRPEELTAAIDLALQQEMAGLAVELAQLGSQLFPHHERIQRAARVLAPPVARSTHLPPARGLKASRRWVRDHARKYRGQWVAVREGELVGVGSSMEELQAVIDHEEDGLHILITKVL